MTNAWPLHSVVDRWSMETPFDHQQTVIAQHVTKSGGRVVEKYVTCACAHIHVCVREKHTHPTCHTSPATPMSHCPTRPHPWMLFGILNYSKVKKHAKNRKSSWSMRLSENVSEQSGITITTIHKFENGTSSNISLGTFLLLLKAIGQISALDELMPDLPPSAYLMKEEKKVQRIRHKKSW